MGPQHKSGTQEPITYRGVPDGQVLLSINAVFINSYWRERPSRDARSWLTELSQVLPGTADLWLTLQLPTRKSRSYLSSRVLSSPLIHVVHQSNQSYAVRSEEEGHRQRARPCRLISLVNLSFLTLFALINL